MNSTATRNVALIILLAPLGFGATYSNQVVSKTDPGNSCTTPPAASSFLTTDGRVYLHFSATTVLSDRITANWLAPDGTVIDGGSWGSVSGTYCYIGAWLNIDPNTVPSKLGAWSVRVYASGTLLFSIPFTLSAPGGGPEPSNPRIDDITPKTSAIGEMNLYDIYGSGFKQNFSGRLRVNGAPNQWVISGAEAIFINSTHVQMRLRVGATSDPTANFSLQVINPPPGNEASNEFGGLTAQAGGAPPPPSGSGFSVNDRVEATQDAPAGNSNIRRGQQGAVACIFTGGEGWDVLVDWDNDVGGHSGFGSCANKARAGHGWAVQRDSIRKVSGGAPPPGSGITVSWVGQPPTSVESGKNIEVAWSVSGTAPDIRSRVIFAVNASPAPSNPQYATPWSSGGNITQRANITVPTTTTGSNIAFIVQVQANGQDYFSTAAYSSVQASPSGPPPGRNLWIYSADPTRTIRCPNCGEQLTDFLIVLEKGSESPTYKRYTITVLGDNLIEISNASLNIVRTAGVRLQPQSTQTHRNPNTPGRGLLSNLLAGADGGWEDLTTVTPYIDASEQVRSVLRDVIGFLPGVGKFVGGAISLRDLYGDIGDLWVSSDNVLPSSALSLLMQDVNNNHVDNLIATRLRAPFDGNLVYGLRFSALIDDSVAAPQFFLKVKNSRGTVIGVEINADPSSPRLLRR